MIPSAASAAAAFTRAARRVPQYGYTDAAGVKARGFALLFGRVPLRVVVFSCSFCLLVGAVGYDCPAC